MKKKYFELPTVGEILLTEFIEPLGLSQNALAQAIGVPQNRISDIINGKRGVTADTDLRLCKYFGMSNGFFTRIQNHLDQAVTRRLIEQDLDEIIPYAHANDNLVRSRMYA
jgi:addiction module HigA family antidote